MGAPPTDRPAWLPSLAAQLGPAGSAAHGRVGERLVELGIDALVAVGPGGRAIAEAAPGVAAAAGVVADGACVAAGAPDSGVSDWGAHAASRVVRSSATCMLRSATCVVSASSRARSSVSLR